MTVYPIYNKDCYVSTNSYRSFRKLAPDHVSFTRDASNADLQIVFEMKKNALTSALGIKRIFQSNLVAFAEDDLFNVPIIPGLYVSLTRNFATRNRASSHAYLSYMAETDGNPHCKGHTLTPKKYLGCFTGKSNIPLRKHIFETLRNEAGYFLKDTLKTYNHFHGERMESEQVSYVQSIRDSEFAICPRGEGASSIRLFESLRLGTAPIIIGDAWTPPLGPRWDDFSFRVKENAIHSIPELVKTNRHRHQEMGMLARQAFEAFYSPQTIVSDILDQLNHFSKYKTFERTRRFQGYIRHLGFKVIRRLNISEKNRKRQGAKA